MGEKTTIEIEKMRELKQHALDTNKTLKQIINEAIEEKINRERTELSLSPILNSTEGSAQSSIEEDSDSGTEGGLFDPEIATILKKECSRHGLDLNSLSSSNWSTELETGIQKAIEFVYDEEVALDTVKQLKSKYKIN